MAKLWKYSKWKKPGKKAIQNEVICTPEIHQRCENEEKSWQE